MKYKVFASVTENRHNADIGLSDTEIEFEINVESPSEILITDAVLDYINENTDYALASYNYE